MKTLATTTLVSLGTALTSNVAYAHAEAHADPVAGMLSQTGLDHMIAAHPVAAAIIAGGIALLAVAGVVTAVRWKFALGAGCK